MTDHPSSEPTTQEVLQFLTTEHLTLQTARAAAVADLNARLQLYMGALSSSIIALALSSQVFRIGDAFRGFAFVLLPAVYVLGLLTLGRISQSWLEWFRATQGINRIRHFYVELAPQMETYFVMPTRDDPWATLGAVGIEGRRWWHGLYTAHAAVWIIESIVAGVVGALLGSVIKDGEGLLIPVAVALPPSCSA